jgi:pimeloyl-ACP methyl ester carboxylesterase
MLTSQGSGTVLHRREWGGGQPVIAMHPLGLDSSAFEGFGRVLARRHLQTIAVDLPGFGQTPAADDQLTPAIMAAPVVALARSLPSRPVVLGISMGGRVALEAAITAPEAFRAVIAIAPALPWLRFRLLVEVARLIDPGVAAWLPLERGWGALRWLARALETLPYLRDDEVAQAGARLVYYLSCPATRRSFLAAARALAIDPAHGDGALWSCLPGLSVPAVFLWGGRDRLISLRFSRAVARACPGVPQVLLPCLGHWMNGPHHRCLADAVGGIVTAILDGGGVEPATFHAAGVPFVTRSCVAARPAGADVRMAGARDGV